MIPDTYHILIALCIITIISYLFNIIADHIKVPSVILLIGCGIILQQITNYYGMSVLIPRTVLELLGVIGLIMIVLEGALDLKITPDKKRLITKSLLVAASVLFITTIAVADILYFAFEISLKRPLFMRYQWG